jgi:hypothetical protein
LTLADSLVFSSRTMRRATAAKKDYIQQFVYAIYLWSEMEISLYNNPGELVIIPSSLLPPGTSSDHDIMLSACVCHHMVFSGECFASPTTLAATLGTPIRHLDDCMRRIVVSRIILRAATAPLLSTLLEATDVEHFVGVYVATDFAESFGSWLFLGRFRIMGGCG